MSGIVTSNILDSTGLIKTSSVAVGLTFISKQTASSSATLSFTSGIDSTYKEYIFYFKDIHPQTDNVGFMFNLSIDGGSNYNVTKTSTNFRAFHAEGGDGQDLRLEPTTDLAQSTAFQDLTREDSGNDNDECIAGYLHLFNPSSTTFVKNFIANTNSTHEANYSHQNFVAGYGNTTSPIDSVQFKMSSGNIDAGDICLYGLTK